MFSQLAQQAGSSTSTLYVDDVFSTYLYAGNGSTRNIINNIDLLTNDGIVWTKRRTGTGYNNEIYNTVRGVTKYLQTDNTNSEGTATTGVSAFNSNGYTLANTRGNTNESGIDYVSWTFRKAPKFFDIVTWIGTDNIMNISHSLGVKPGMIVIKSLTSSTDPWYLYHVGLDGVNGAIRAADKHLLLNSTAPTQNVGVNSGIFNNTEPTSTVFTIGAAGGVNTTGHSYVAMLFAHDPTTSGVIQCGSVTGGSSVNLGWEPQYVLIKRSDSTSDWFIFDSMRGFTVGGPDTYLAANLSSAEAGGTNWIEPSSTGFSTPGFSGTHVYLAIRRPNKPPTSGTQVYNAALWNGNSTTRSITGVGFSPDWLILTDRDKVNSSSNYSFARLCSPTNYLITDQVFSESASSGFNVKTFDPDGFSLADNGNVNGTGDRYIGWNFRRAPGVFDVVCDTGTGSAHTISHGLGVVPELIFRKDRTTSGTNWVVWCDVLGNNYNLYLNNTNGATLDTSTWNNTSPTSSNFTVGTSSSTNGSGDKFVTYLFATNPGISKVGSYNGNGGSQNINMGFTTGARFFLVKATSTTGSWWVYDSVRGITSLADSALQLNSTVAEITTADAVDPNASGLIVNQEATCSINATGVTYIYLAFA